MDAVFGSPENNGGEVHVSVRNANGGKPMFKQLNGITVSDVSEDSITFALQEPGVIGEFDDRIVSSANENSQEWFGRNVKEATLKKAYQSAVDEDGLFSTTIMKDKLRIYDCDKNRVEVDTLVPGTVCNVVVELNRIWFVKRNFGPEWFTVQVKIVKPPETDPYDDYLFQDE